MSSGAQLPQDCNSVGCSVRVFDIMAALYVAAFQYEFGSIHNGRPIDGGGTIDDTVVGAAFVDGFDLEEMISRICYMYRIERVFKADGLYLYRNASLDEPSALAATIDESELAISDTAANGVRYAISTTFLDRSNSVTKITFNFLDADNEFKPNTLTAKSPEAIQTDPEKQVTLPFVMHLQDADTLVNRLVIDDRLSLIQHNFRLPPKFAFLGKGDVIAIKHRVTTSDEAFVDTVRITGTDFNADKSQTVTAVSVSSATVPVAAKSYDSQRSVTSGPLVPSTPLFFDIPTVDPFEGVGSGIGGFFEVYNSLIPAAPGYWLGGYLARNKGKDGDTYATMFHVYGVPGKKNQFINAWQATNALKNKRWCTDSDTLNLANENAPWDTARNVSKAYIDANEFANLAVYGDDGRWEIIQFQSVVDGVMSGIVRGLRGTENNCGKHQPGDRIYTLGPSLILSRLPKEYIGTKAKYKGVSEGGQFQEAPEIEAPAFVGNARKPFAPYHFRGTRGTDGAITFTWLRRDRGSEGWGKPLGMSESALAYEIDICGAQSAVLRTEIVTNEAFVYTPEMQSEDGLAGLPNYLIQVRQRGDVTTGFQGAGLVDV